MIWDILNVLSRLLLTVIVIYMLCQFRERMIHMERVGLGFMGGGSFLTIPIIIDRDGNPFSGWATFILTFGAVLFLAGRTWRDRKHERANAIASAEAHDYLKSRGKL